MPTSIPKNIIRKIKIKRCLLANLGILKRFVVSSKQTKEFEAENFIKLTGT
jgi:hypothetical protein